MERSELRKNMNILTVFILFILIFTALDTAFAESNVDAQYTADLSKPGGMPTNQSNSTRYDYSVEYPARVVVATGDNFPDALVATPIASWLDENGTKQCTPLTLVSDELPAGFYDNYDSIKNMIMEVCIVGGTESVSSSIETKLRQYFPNANLYRYSGSDRYETSVNAALKEWNNESKGVIITTGEKFPDSTVAGPLASYLSYPILLVQKDSIPSKVKQAIQTLGASEAIIIGGSSAVSANVENEIKNLGLNVTRLFGDNRYETAAVVADYYTSEMKSKGIIVNDVLITTGLKFPDALAGGCFGFMRNAPILFITGAGFPDCTVETIQNINPQALTILGGSEVVPLEVDINNGEDFAIGRLAGENRYETASIMAKVVLYEVLPLQWYDYALVVGNPNKDTENDLPWAEEEALYVADTLQNAGLNVRSYIGSLATRYNVLNYLSGGVGIFHFTGHGFFDFENWENSGLVLSDGFLTIEDVNEQVDFNGEHPLVFANACESGITIEDWNGALMGLSTAFVFKGAIGYIGTLDSVFDEPAAYLGSMFYDELMSGDTVGIALRDTKRWLIENGYTGYYGPSGLDTWQAFVLYGDPMFRPMLPT